MRTSRYLFVQLAVILLVILGLTSCSGALDTPVTIAEGDLTADSASQSEVSDATPAVAQPDAPTTQDQEQSYRPAEGGPFSNFTTADFSGPSACTLCHTGLVDESGTDVSMPTAWRSTMMALSGIDPVWQAKVSSEVARQPALQEVIEAKCVGCHMPMAKTQALTDGLEVAALEDGFYNTSNPLHVAAIDGVSCTLCHQVDSQNLGEMDSFSGGYVIKTETNPPDRPIYGPYQQPVTPQMQNHTGFIPVYGEHMLSAEHCATCHNLYTPYVDSQGNILGEFPEQTPYTEWQFSNFGTQNVSCQICHMPFADGGVVISTMPMKLAAREPFFQHFFVGGNQFMLQILANWGADLEVTASQEELSITMSRVVEQIGNRTAYLVLVDSNLENDTLTMDLKVNPMTGHKFPTSFPSRRAWLHVTVTDAAGQVIFESGKHNTDGTISGNAADFDPTEFEPHYEIITQDDQVQIYEAIMGNSDGEVTYTLLRSAYYIKDNRLLPSGAEKTQLPEDIAVYGEAAADDDFVDGSDLVTYRVDVSGYQAPFSINAELLYETLSYQFVQDMLLDETSLTELFGSYYILADKTPLVVDSIQPETIQ